jgi:hypothetical protein
MNADERGSELSTFICVKPRLLIYSLKIVVEHSSMTNQTHLLRQLDVGRPDQGATPRTDDVVLRLGTLQIAIARINTLTQS